MIDRTGTYGIGSPVSVLGRTMKLSLQHKAVADIRFAPIAALAGLGFIGHAIAGALGAGVALLLPLTLQALGAFLSAFRELLPARWRGDPY